MTERRDTQSAETTHSVWEALPHATVRYQTVCSAVKDNPEVPCTYGLACLTECQGAWVQTDCIEDVSPSRDNVLCLASQFNRLGLAPVHFRDAVLDSING